MRIHIALPRINTIMGRKPSDKPREDNPKLKRRWASKIAPLYFRDGMSAFAMDEVADKLGISKATLYKHFSSRQDILNEIVKLKLEELIVFKNTVLDQNRPYEERLFTAAQTAAMLMAGISNAFLQDVRENNEDVWQFVRNFQDDALDTMRKFYQEGIDKGHLSDVNPHVLAVIDRLFVRAVADPQFLKDNNLDLKTAVEEFFKVKSFGIFKRNTDKGSES